MVVQYCSCDNDFQDERYGKGMRVMNLMQGKKDDKVRCTICVREHSLKGSVPVAMKKKGE